MAAQDVASRVTAALDERRSFLLDAGAGAGKTYTLVQALRHLLTERRAALEASGGRIACITYTNVAKDEIRERVGADPLISIATIHEFLWAEIERFQGPLRSAIIARNTESESPQSLESLTPNVPIRYVQLGRALEEGRVSHDDVLALSHSLISGHRKLARIIANRFPYILVDEYQDTSPLTIEVLLGHLAQIPNSSSCIGLFGDSMQQIYRTGVGEISGYPDLERISKEENRRSSKAVIDVLNAMRPSLTQRPTGVPRNGEVHFFLQRQVPKTQRLASALDQLESQGWSRETAKRLYLTHRSIAQDLDYSNLQEAYRKARRTESLQDGTDPLARQILDIELLCTAYEAEDHKTLAGLLSTKSTRITRHRDKGRISRALQQTTAERAKLSVAEVFDQVHENGLLPKSREIIKREALISAEGLDIRAQRKADLTRAVLELPYSEAIAYNLYMTEQTPLATQHGVKGAEFDDVIVVIDDKAWTMYSLDELLAAPFGTKDRIPRTKNLFYVSCSRARNRLAVVILSDISAPAESTAHEWFRAGTIHP